MERKYIADNPEWMQDWDWDENKKVNNDPGTLTVGSRKRVFWLCHVCGGKWDTRIKERRGCPFCAGFRALAGFNDLETTNPELAEEWDEGKNLELKPSDVTAGSKKKVFWLCAKGHSWQMDVHSRVIGQNCPVCRNRQVLKGYNDLATINPSLAAEWNYARNDTLTPGDVVAGTKKRVWWWCANGHEWEAPVIRRNAGNGCPICANRIIVRELNDFATEHPELVEEWDYERNAKSPDEYACFSREKVWWVCKKGHRWKAAIGDRSRGNGCAKCSEERRVSFPEKAVLYYINQLFENVTSNYRASWLGTFELDIYLEDQRIAIEYDGEYGHSTKEGIERDRRKNAVCHENGITLIRIREPKCKMTDSTSIEYVMESDSDLPEAIDFAIRTIWRLSGVEENIEKDFIDIARDSGEIYSLIEYSEKENSLLLKAPEIAGMWHPTKNGKLTPDHVQAGSQKKVWWLGKCGHEWLSPVAYEVSSGKCPYCTGKRVLTGFNDLSTLNPELAKEWDHDKNGALTPEAVTVSSGKKVWWLCSKKHSWQASVVSRNRGNGCIFCANRATLKGFNDLGTRADLVIDWSDKNALLPEQLCIGSERKIWWKCHQCGHEWTAPIAARARGRGCPECKSRERQKNANATRIKNKGNLADTHPELMQEWDPKNLVNPKNIVPGYTKKVGWICKCCGNKWQATVISRVSGRGCPKCADIARAKTRQERLLRNKLPITVTHPDIVIDWDYNKNEISPEKITAGSGRYVWWKCHKCGNEWNARICERTRNRAKCGVCK